MTSYSGTDGSPSYMWGNNEDPVSHNDEADRLTWCNLEALEESDLIKRVTFDEDERDFFAPPFLNVDVSVSGEFLHIWRSPLWILFPARRATPRSWVRASETEVEEDEDGEGCSPSAVDARARALDTVSVFKIFISPRMSLNYWMNVWGFLFRLIPPHTPHEASSAAWSHVSVPLLSCWWTVWPTTSFILKKRFKIWV